MIASSSKTNNPRNASVISFAVAEHFMMIQQATPKSLPTLARARIAAFAHRLLYAFLNTISVKHAV